MSGLSSPRKTCWFFSGRLPDFLDKDATTKLDNFQVASKKAFDPARGGRAHDLRDDLQRDSSRAILL